MSETSNSVLAESTIEEAGKPASAILVSRVKNVKGTTTTTCEAAKIVEEIRTDQRLREKITPIRDEFWRVMAETNNGREAAKKAVDEPKKELRAITWSGTFSKRNDQDLLQHSGLLCADLDGLGPERMPDVRSQLRGSPYLWADFLSPTGDGIKAVFRVRADGDLHSASYRAVEAHVQKLTGVQIDEKCKNIGRLCFLSSDPDAHLNEAAVELPPLFEAAGPKPVPTVGLTNEQAEMRRRIAVDLLGGIKWTDENFGLCTCPGRDLHQTANGERDCRVYIDGAGWMDCFHESCKKPVAEAISELQVRLRRSASADRLVLPPPIDALQLIRSELPRPPEIIHGVLHQGSKMVIGGGSKSFKTWTLIDLAVSVATGTAWWGFETTQGRVVYMNFEVQDSFFRERLLGVCDAKDCDLQEGQLVYWGLRGKAADLGMLMQQIVSMLKDGGYSLIVFDPIYKGLGDRDENKTGDIATLCNEIESLAVQTGAAVAFGHHFSKGNQAKKESIDRMGGSGVFSRDPDSILTMTKHKNEDAFTVDATLRNFSPIKPFVVRRVHPLMVCDKTLDPTQLKQQAGRPKTYDIQQLLDCLPEIGLSAGEWEAIVKSKYGMGRTTYNGLRNQALVEGRVEKRGQKFFRNRTVVSFDPTKETTADSMGPAA
jgi:hypothetical protein